MSNVKVTIHRTNDAQKTLEGSTAIVAIISREEGDRALVQMEYESASGAEIVTLLSDILIMFHQKEPAIIANAWRIFNEKIGEIKQVDVSQLKIKRG